MCRRSWGDNPPSSSTKTIDSSNVVSNNSNNNKEEKGENKTTMTTTNNPNTQQYIKETTNLASSDVSGVNFPVNGTRNQFGSRKEFVDQFLLENWNKGSGELASILGITIQSVSRLKKGLRTKEKFLDIAFDDYIRLRSSKDVRDEVKFSMAAKMIGLLIENNTTVQGSSVVIRINDDVSPSAPSIVEAKG